MTENRLDDVPVTGHSAGISGAIPEPSPATSTRGRYTVQGISMNQDEGWIKLHRKLRSSICWTYSLQMRSVWMTILMHANHAPAWWHGVEIQPGQFTTSLSHLARESMVSVSQVRTCIRLLVEWNQVICQNVANQMTKVTICKWETYQESSQTKSQTDSKPIANESQTDSKPIATNKNEENNKNEKNDKKPTPEAGGLTRSWKQWNSEDLLNSVRAANTNNMLDMREEQDFVEYWMEPTATGRSKLSLEKTWDTRRRMKTAVDMVYSKQRQNPNYTPKIAIPLGPVYLGNQFTIWRQGGAPSVKLDTPAGLALLAEWKRENPGHPVPDHYAAYLKSKGK